MASSIAQWMAHLILDLQPWLKYSAKINLPITRRKIILVSNHRSNLDVFILFGNIPRLRVVAKQMLFNLPILGIGMKALNQIPLNKKNWALVPRAIEKMRAGMCAGDHILFFPEMTRCQWGMEKTNKFVEIPFTVAKKENALVVPLVIINTDNAWPKKSIGISYRAPCEVISLDPIDSNNYDKPHELKCEVQRLIDEALLQRS